jgi:hypothetical protein
MNADQLSKRLLDLREEVLPQSGKGETPLRLQRLMQESGRECSLCCVGLRNTRQISGAERIR